MTKTPLEIQERKRAIMVEIAKLAAELENPQADIDSATIHIIRSGNALRVATGPIGNFKKIEVRKYVYICNFGYDSDSNTLVIRDS